MLVTQSSWLLTLSPNCQITIPKSFQTHTFAFRRGNLHSYLLSLFREHKGTKFFALSSPPSILHPTSRQGGQRYEVFRFVKPLPLTLPPSSPPSEGRQSYELFGICKPPYSQRPIPRSRGAQRYEVFRFVKPPFYSASLFLRERKGTKFLILSRLFPFCCPARRLVKTLPG